ncbi:MAG: cytochrome [Bacilli bacterium]|nr:cytochrome [Bacilli bacterium]
MKRTFLGLLIAIIPVLVALGFYREMKTLDLGNQPPGVVKATAFDAKAFVQTTCVSCHGADLHGLVGPDLHKKAQELSAVQIANVLKNGYNGDMPKGLAPGHEDEVAAYIKTLANTN